MPSPALICADATKARDGHDLLAFNCWSGDPKEPYAADAEHYIQKSALRSAHKTLAFRTEDGELVGVSAFDRRLITPYEAAHYRVPGWHLQVIGIDRGFQGTDVTSDLPRCAAEMRTSEYVFRRTYARMLEIDAARVVVTARVHGDNQPSIMAAARVSLERTVREFEEYWRMLGEVDPFINCAP